MHVPPLARQSQNRTGVALKAAIHVGSRWRRGVAAPWRWRGKTRSLAHVVGPFTVPLVLASQPILDPRLVSSTAGHVRAAHREFPPIHHSSGNADLTLAAGDGIVHLRDMVFVSNGLKLEKLSTFPPSGSLTISMASTPHIALPRNIMTEHSIPSILETDIADVVKVSHQPTLISPVATMRASQMPGEACMSLMEWRPCW
jgi:hypothetical protein